MIEGSESDKRVALIFGGRGLEHQISCISACRIMRYIKSGFKSPICIYISSDGGWYFFPAKEMLIAAAQSVDISSLTPTFPVRIKGKSGFLKNGTVLEVDCCVPVLHGDFGEDGVVQGALECAGIPFVGQGVPQGALCADKEYTKLVAISAGIPTAPYAAYRKSVYEKHEAEELLCETKSNFCYPMFIKPAGLGSSLGASAVYSDSEFHDALKGALDLCRGKVLIEKMLSPELELECAFLDGEVQIITEPSSVSVSGDCYGFTEKYLKKSAKTKVKAEISDNLKALVREYSRRLVSRLSLRGLARIDFFLCGGEIYFNEINTFPGFTEDSLYEKMLNEVGIDGEELIKRLVSLAEGDKDDRYI